MTSIIYNTTMEHKFTNDDIIMMMVWPHPPFDRNYQTFIKQGGTLSETEFDSRLQEMIARKIKLRALGFIM